MYKGCKIISQESEVTQYTEYRLMVLWLWCKARIVEMIVVMWWKLTGENQKLFARKQEKEQGGIFREILIKSGIGQKMLIKM